MTHPEFASKRVTAVVDEVLPQMGLAYATDDTGRCWTVTKSMTGIGLASLQAGQRIEITVTERHHCTVASGYAPLN